MNTLLLQPSDILFFRDGRPMSGSLAGHGAAWPLPTVLSAALHAALWRSDIVSHPHRRGGSGSWNDDQRDRRFGSVFSAGPFPENDGAWYFPRPADADDTGRPILFPCQTSGPSSLQPSWLKPVASRNPPSKIHPKRWWNQAAIERYLNPAASPQQGHLIDDSDFCDTEHSIGIGIDPESGTQNGEQFYSANYLRLKPGWRLACLAEAKDKEHQGQDIIKKLFKDDNVIVVGGQQRVCTVTRSENPPPNLPVGPSITGTRVKWVLLTPAIFPQIGNHPGGSLPSWVNHQTGFVELLDGPGKNAAARRGLPPGKPILSRLVASVVGKPIPVTGYALPHETIGTQGGAKPTHLAVPAGSVFYFEGEGNDDAEKIANAQKLAAALNWHGGDASPTTIRNRRSTLMGEKGFGLGVCGPWQDHPEASQQPA